ncbi:hypothetical protein [Actinokineospora xionganensis]|uniref:Uncharacterized protein n=1 Tax=Actinokineospora xionganensis TaxID=2684470 RepID=A0ABR7L0N3_9PSEU|nr:hypothetical protein [Actinokineospora xionganensis]MBC6446078.1 hypothetical protein [Actinokineospora xionganensis]
MTEPSPSGEPTAVRLLFEYEGDEVRLLLQQPVDVAVSGFDLPREHVVGNHVEVRDANEEMLSRVPIRSGMDTSVEVFPEDPNEPITRADVPRAQGAFTVVVPTTERADHVTVVRIPPTGDVALADAGATDVVELGTFPLAGGAR